MTLSTAEAPRAPRKAEFVALMAMLMATIAFSLDAMLPALPQIAADLTPDHPNRAQLIVTSFVLGLGLGTFIVGPIADRYGRRNSFFGFVALYIAAALVGWLAGTLELMLAARIVMGIGAAGPRVVSLAIIRDLYAGRQMAQMISFVMVVFTMAPAIAPSLGALIVEIANWRAIFPAFVVFIVIAALWLGLRQPETLAPEDRRPLTLGPLWQAIKEILAQPVMRRSILIQVLIFGMLFGNLSSIQSIFHLRFDMEASFPLWFAVIAVAGAAGGFLNAALVVRVGMRAVVSWTLAIQGAINVLFLLGALGGVWPEHAYFGIYFVWTTSVFMLIGMTIGNLNALALEPLGHIAGTATSVMTSISTVGAALIAVPIGLSFDGTPLPVAIGILLCSLLANLLMRGMPRAKMAR